MRRLRRTSPVTSQATTTTASVTTKSVIHHPTTGQPIATETHSLAASIKHSQPRQVPERRIDRCPAAFMPLDAEGQAAPIFESQHRIRRHVPRPCLEAVLALPRITGTRVMPGIHAMQ